MDTATIKVGIGGASVVGVAFGMARYAYGLTLPDVRTEFGLSELLLGLIASGTFAGYLLGLVSAPWLAARRGPRAPTTAGGLCAVVGCATVALASSPGVLAVGAVLGGSAAGWVWAPYSDIVTQAVPRRYRSTLLALITTGTSLGLMALAALGLVATASSWRLTWAGIALAAALAALVNLRTVPRLPARHRHPDSPHAPTLRRSMVRPLAYAVLYSAAITVYFTYASDVARSSGLTAWAAALLFAVIGIGGLAALRTGRMIGELGAAGVGAISVCVVGAALLLLAVGRTSVGVVVVSALIFGAGFMVGSAVIAIWTAQVAPDRPGDGFTVTLVVGALTSIASPAVMGAAIPVVGLPAMLALVAGVTVTGTLVVTLVPAPRTLAARRSARG